MHFLYAYQDPCIKIKTLEWLQPGCNCSLTYLDLWDCNSSQSFVQTLPERRQHLTGWKGWPGWCTRWVLRRTGPAEPEGQGQAGAGGVGPALHCRRRNIGQDTDSCNCPCSGRHSHRDNGCHRDLAAKTGLRVGLHTLWWSVFLLGYLDTMLINCRERSGISVWAYYF